jgi:hypothetical protein
MKTILIILALFLSYSLEAQTYLTPSGTVTDGDSQIWAYSNVTFQLVYSGIGNPVFKDTGQKVPLTCSGNIGQFATFQVSNVGCPSGNTGTGLPNNADILPTGTQWRITICSATSAPCQTLTPQAFTTAYTNVGGFISGQITSPRIEAAKTAYAYNTTEIINQTNGSGYTNTITAISYLWNGAWTAIGGGGSSGLTSFQGRTTPAATLQESDVSGILSSGSYGILAVVCGVQNQQGYWYTNGDGIANCDNQVEAADPGQTVYSNAAGNIIAQIGVDSVLHPISPNSLATIVLYDPAGNKLAYMTGDNGGTVASNNLIWQSNTNVTCIGTDNNGSFVDNSSACSGGGSTYLTGTTGTIGGIGECQSGTATVPGANSGEAAVASPANGELAGIINSIIAYVSGTDTVTVTVCTIGLTSGVPPNTYSVAVFP